MPKSEQSSAKERKVMKTTRVDHSVVEEKTPKTYTFDQIKQRPGIYQQTKLKNSHHLYWIVPQGDNRK